MQWDGRCPWLNLVRDSAWDIAKAEVRSETEERIILDAYEHAVWSPEADCELCRDHGFGTDAAIRLWGEISPVAMYAGSWPCMVPGLDSFSELWLRLFDRARARLYRRKCWRARIAYTCAPWPFRAETRKIRRRLGRACVPADAGSIQSREDALRVRRGSPRQGRDPREPACWSPK